MTVSLVIILIVSGLLYRWPQLAQRRRDDGFRWWLGQLRPLRGPGLVMAALAGPILAVLLLMGVLALLPGHNLWQWLLAIAVLLLTLGPRELDPDLRAVQTARSSAEQLQALTALHDETMASLSWEQSSVAEAVAYAALHRRFGVVFWFVLLGPPGAVLYRASQSLGRDASLDLSPSQRNLARYAANALDWLPAHLLVFTLAVVDHWDAVIDAWRAWHTQAGRAGWYGAEPGFLGAAARSTVPPGEASPSAADVLADPALTAGRLQKVFRRAWFSWLAVLALLALGGWISHLN